MDEFVGPFRLVREIGRGHNAVVYEAHDTRRDETVALKVLHLAETDPETGQPAPHAEATLMRFVREADAIRRLQHPNIVRIRDAGSDGGRLYIAMERLHGETLRARVADAPLPPALAASVARQIADALSLAHSLGIFHRDIKPDNIFLLPDGTAKLMDFGAARLASEFSLTQTGNVIGSPAYMAPEQVVGEECDARTDVWGLGATLFESVTGQKPFPGDTVTGVMYAILHKRPDFSQVPSVALAALLERALSKRRAGRQATMNEFASELRRIAETGSSGGGARVVAGRHGGAHSNATALVSRWKRRPAALLPLVLAGGAMLAVLLFGAVLVPRRSSRNVEPRKTAAIPPRLVATNTAAPERANPAPTMPAAIPNATAQPNQTATAVTPIKQAAPPVPQPRLRSAPAPPARAAVLVVERPPAPQVASLPVRRAADSAAPRRSATVARDGRKNAPAPPSVLVAPAAPDRDAFPARRSAPAHPLVYERPARPGEDRPAEEIPGAIQIPHLPRGLRLRTSAVEVGLRLTINADGVVERSVVIEPSGITEVDDLAQEAALGWEFYPALKDGRPVASEHVLFVNLVQDRSRAGGRGRSGD